MLKPDGGTLIRATLRSADLIPAFLDELERLLDEPQDELREENSEILDAIEQSDEVPPGFEDAASELVYGLADALDDHAQKFGYVFQTTEGDGSDFGFWVLGEEVSTDG